jgi:glycine/D-amino acid oxidase-like deaminating enzyme
MNILSRQQRDIIIIGGGSQGIALALELAGRGYLVKILEMNEGPGMGSSLRSDFMPYGTGHSGVLFMPTDTLRVAYTDMMNAAIRNPDLLPTPSLQILLDNSVVVGKNLIAHTQEDVAKLKGLDNLAKQRPIYNIVEPQLLLEPTEIKALKESLFESSGIGIPQGILRLPHVRIIHIANYVRDMARLAAKEGCEILYEHEVIGFTVGNGTSHRTGVVSKTKNGEKEHFADMVINLSGYHASHITELANKTVEDYNATHTKNPGALGTVPTTYYWDYGLLVPNPGTPESTWRADSLSYFAGVMHPQGTTLGLHAYIGPEEAEGRPIRLGTVRHAMDSRTDLLNSTALPSVPDVIAGEARKILPGIHLENFTQHRAGKVATYFYNGIRDIAPTVTAAFNAGFIGLHMFTGDTPGLCCSPLIAWEAAKKATALLDNLAIPTARKLWFPTFSPR